MAQTLSTNATNVTANPQVPLNNGVNGGAIKVSFETVTFPDSANADSHITGVRIPVNAHILSVKFGCDDLGTAGTIDIGLFKRDGLNLATFTAVDVDAIANNIDVNAAAVAIAERLVVANIGKKAWDLAGLSANPAYDHFFIGLTSDTGTTAAGSAFIQVEYVLG